MIIEQPGVYRLKEDYSTRGSYSVGTLPAGTEITISQVNREGCQVIGPDLLDWAYWDLPVEKVS